MSTSTATAAPIAQKGEPVNPKFALPELPTVKGAEPSRNVLDAARLIVAKTVSEAWGLDIKKVFDGVDLGGSICHKRSMQRSAHLVLGKKGADLAVAIPRFVKGKPDEPAKKVLDAVSSTSWLCYLRESSLAVFSSNRPPWLPKSR